MPVYHYPTLSLTHKCIQSENTKRNKKRTCNVHLLQEFSDDIQRRIRSSLRDVHDGVVPAEDVVLLNPVLNAIRVPTGKLLLNLTPDIPRHILMSCEFVLIHEKLDVFHIIMV